MIEKIDRNIILERHENIASQISGMQRAFYDEDDLNSCETDEEKKEYLSSYDAVNIYKDSKKSFNNTISFDYSDIETFTKVLTQNLTKLLSEFKIEKLIIITHFKMNFFGNLKIKHKHLKSAYDNLSKIVGCSSYEEAFKIDIEDLFNFIDSFFWMERIDGSAPEYIYFFDEKERLGFNLCRHGKVHTIEFDREILTPKVLNKYGWENVNDCSDTFNEIKIKGRKIKV